MALNIQDQISLFGKPIGDKKLIDFVFQGAVNFASQFYDTAKDVDSETQPDAYSYRTKILRVCDQVKHLEMNRSFGLLSTLEREFISVVGLSGVTISQVNNATPAQWMSFITTNIKEVFENLGGVIIQEAAQYNTPS
jgi:hypothetical protein